MTERSEPPPPPASENVDLVHLRQLQLQLQRAESKWKMSDDRARSNEHLLNQKLVEISKLQSVVAKQSKVGMQFLHRLGPFVEYLVLIIISIRLYST